MSGPNKFLITQSLLSSWGYALKSGDMDDFLSTLRRERRPQTRAMLDGIRFEHVVQSVAQGAEIGADHEWYRPATEIAGIVRGAQYQVTMDKQTASAALILAADALSEEWIFQDGIRLKPRDITPYLVSKETVNQNGRALQYLYDFVNINQAKFTPNTSDYTGEVWGDMDDSFIYIIKSKFDQILNDEGYNSTAFIGWAKNNGLLDIGIDGKSTRTRRIRGKVARCIKLRQQVLDFEEVDSDLPDGWG